MKKYIKPLKKFGLTDNEAKVYIECLKKEDLSPYQISKFTGIPRTTIYDTLMSLSLKGLIELEQSDGFTKQQTKVKAKNPSILREILKEKRDETYKTEAQIIEILPELKDIFHKDDSNSSFRYFAGVEGVKKVYFRMENHDMHFPELAFTKLMPLDVFGSKEINEDILKGTMNKKITNQEAREIIPLNDWTKHVLSYQYNLDPNYVDARNFRYIEGPLFEMFLDVVIKGDFIFLACAEDDEVWGVEIRSEALSKSMRSMFNVMWNIAKPVTPALIKSFGDNGLLKAQKDFGFIK